MLQLNAKQSDHYILDKIIRNSSGVVAAATAPGWGTSSSLSSLNDNNNAVMQKSGQHSVHITAPHHSIPTE